MLTWTKVTLPKTIDDIYRWKKQQVVELVGLSAAVYKKPKKHRKEVQGETHDVVECFSPLLECSSRFLRAL